MHGLLNVSRCTVFWMYHDARSSECITMHGLLNVLRCTVFWTYHDARSSECITMHGLLNVSRCTVFWMSNLNYVLTQIRIIFPVALRPKADHGLPIIEVYRPHATKQHSQQGSSGRVISSSQGPGTPILCLEPAIPASVQPKNYALYRGDHWDRPTT